MRDQRSPHEPVAHPHHSRSSLRLREFDYSTPGAYFVTICTAGKVCLFGQVVEDGVSLTAAGSLVASTWSEMPHHYPTVQIDAFVVMPNHIHGIVILTEGQPNGPSPQDGQAWEPAPTPTPTSTQDGQAWEPAPAVGPTTTQEGQAWQPAPTPGPTTSQDGQAWEPAPTVGPSTTPGAGLKPGQTFGLSDTIHRFKSLTTRRFAELGHSCGPRPSYHHLWQRNYYEHVIRDYDSVQRIREYIANNPLAWDLDRENPSTKSTSARVATTDTWQV